MSHWNTDLGRAEISALEERQGRDLLLYFWGLVHLLSAPFIWEQSTGTGHDSPIPFPYPALLREGKVRNWGELWRMGRAQAATAGKPLLGHPSPTPLIPPWSLCIPLGIGILWGWKNMEFQQHCPLGPMLCRKSPKQVLIKVWFTFINAPDSQSWHSWNHSHHDPQTFGHRNYADGIWQTQSSEITWNNFVFLDVALQFPPEFPFKEFAEFSLKLPCLLLLLTDFIGLQKPQATHKKM